MSRQFDKTLNPLDDVCFKNRADALIRKYKWVRKTHFNRSELTCILFIFFKITRKNGKKANYITLAQLNEILSIVFGMSDGFLMQRIHLELIGSAVSTLEAHSWIKMMNIFCRGTLDEKIVYCYNVYDPSGEGIRRDQMMNLLRRTIFKHEVEDIEETTKGLVDLIMRKMDTDRDGKISFGDYKSCVIKNPEMLECFGICLPDREHVFRYLVTITDRVKF